METLIRVSTSDSPTKQDVIHNRWHPDIPIVAWVKPGDQFRVECVDWTGGQIADNDSAHDIKVVDLTKVHYLSGPIGVKGAEPGDLLQVVRECGRTQPETRGAGGMPVFQQVGELPRGHPGRLGELQHHSEPGGRQLYSDSNIRIGRGFRRKLGLHWIRHHERRD